MAKTMQAIHIPEFIQSLSSLSPTSIPLPDVEPTTLLIRVTHVSPTHVDILYARGQHQNNRRHAKPPMTLGTDFAGVVVRAPAASGLRQGERVYGSYYGAYAEFVAVDTRVGLGSVRRVPRGWTNGQACAVGSSGAISLGCFLRAGGVRAGRDWVLVTGASGGLGIIACQIAKAMGAKVIALVGDEEKSKVLKDVGVDECVQYNEKGWEGKVQEISDGGVSIVYDGAGMVESSLRCCKFGGTVVIVGFAGRGGEMELLKVNRILLKSAGVLGYRFGEHGRRAPSEVRKIWDDFDGMIQRGVIKPVVYKESYHGLRDIPRALEDLEARKVYGRAVVSISDENPESISKPSL